MSCTDWGLCMSLHHCDLIGGHHQEDTYWFCSKTRPIISAENPDLSLSLTHAQTQRRGDFWGPFTLDLSLWTDPNQGVKFPQNNNRAHTHWEEGLMRRFQFVGFFFSLFPSVRHDYSEWSVMQEISTST